MQACPIKGASCGGQKYPNHQELETHAHGKSSSSSGAVLMYIFVEQFWVSDAVGIETRNVSLMFPSILAQINKQ